MVATAPYSVIVVFWKETAFAFPVGDWRAAEEDCFSGVFCDCGDASPNLFCQLNGHLVPYTSCLHCKGIEYVCSSGWHTCLSSSVLLCWLPHLVWSPCCQRGTLYTCLVLSRLRPWVSLLPREGEWSRQDAVVVQHQTNWFLDCRDLCPFNCSPLLLLVHTLQ